MRTMLFGITLLSLGLSDRMRSQDYLQVHIQFYDVRPIGESLQAVLMPGFGDILEKADKIPALTLRGPKGRRYTIETSSTIGPEARWKPLTTVTLGTTPSLALDIEGKGAKARFFRTRLIPEKPPIGNPNPERLVWIPAGTFIMGSPPDEQNRDTDEQPLTQVTFTKGFWMDKFEVTQKDYVEIMGSNPSRFKPGENRPVDNVTWSWAMEYCEKLTQREQAAGRLPEGFVYRLPTEAEWEYACRAGTTTRYSHGNDPEFKLFNDYAWHLNNSNNQTHDVGTKLPNPWGIYGLHGGVYEWCLGWHVFYPGGSVTDYISPPGQDHVLRGGAWSDLPMNGRAAERHWFGLNLSYGNIGFRVILADPYALVSH
jgi:formylglycine-generating enzyme required for sulfatase activity